MAGNLFVTAIGEGSGKSVVTLGAAELLLSRVERLGYFRPVVGERVARCGDIELIRRRYCPHLSIDALTGVTLDEADRLYTQGRMDAVLERILEQYKRVEAEHDFVLCEGIDFGGLGDFFEFDFNAQVARHLGAPVLAVVPGKGRSASEILETAHAARDLFTGAGCAIAAWIVNRTDPGVVGEVARAFADREDYPEPVYVLPTVPSLESPTVGEIREALGASLIRGSADSLYREALDVCVAAMHLPYFLKYIREGTLVVTPGDRCDVLLASLATVPSEGYPAIAGVVLTGGISLPETIVRLLEGLSHVDLPVLAVPDDTLTAARRIARIRASIRPDNDRKIATALGLFESKIPASELYDRIDVARPSATTPLMFEYQLIERAKSDRKRIVLPEGTDSRILRAAEILVRRRVVDVILLGDAGAIREQASALGVDLGGITVVDPSRSPWHASFAQEYFELRRHRGVTEETAHEIMFDVSYFGTMMVRAGHADGMVSGAVHTTGHTIRPALEFIRTRPGCSIVSSVFFMCLPDRVLVYGDCAIVPRPTAEQLADIATSSADTAAAFGIEPRVALLSYSTGDSGAGDDVDRVRHATQLAQQRRPDLPIDGPLQYDAAIDPDVGRRKRPDSRVAGRATVFVFPDLNTGNNTYKAVQRSTGAIAIGPVLQGLKQPVNDLSRGCTVKDIVNTVAITAIQAQQSQGPA